jgi:nucleoside-diphosphate-sugar epimerase
MAKVLVTGGTGLVGNRLARLLVERGHDVRALVRSVERAGKLLDGVELVPGDVTDRATIEPALDGIRWVFHCAGVPEQWTADPGIFDRVNRGGTANLLQANARRLPPTAR